MSARATWKGLLKISLVTIPIKVYPATESRDGLKFHQLHSACQSPIHQRRWCASCAIEVPSADIVKGFEFERGRYVILQPEELDAVQPPSTRVIELVQVADVDELDPLHIDRTYYLAPDGAPAAAAYAVLREGLEGKVGIGTLAIYGREYLVAVRKSLWILVLHTLHHAAEVRPIDAIAELAAIPHKVNPDEVALAHALIKTYERPLELAAFQDQYRAELQALIDAKIAGKDIAVPTPVRPPVIALRDALTQSLAAVSAAKKTPAKVAPAKKKRAS